MEGLHTVEMYIVLVALGLVVIIFGCFAPWYKSWAGCTLFGVKVSFFMVMLLIVLSHEDVTGWGVDALRFAVYPVTTATSISLLILMTLTQLHRWTEMTARLLFRRKDEPPPSLEWDGVDRRRPRD